MRHLALTRRREVLLPYITSPENGLTPGTTFLPPGHHSAITEICTLHAITEISATATRIKQARAATRRPPWTMIGPPALSSDTYSKYKSKEDAHEHHPVPKNNSVQPGVPFRRIRRGLAVPTPRRR